MTIGALVQRAVSLILVPTAQGNPLDDRYFESSGSFGGRAGIRVTPETAMKVSAVYRCVSILANVLAMFPKGMFEKLDRGRNDAPDHPLDRLISFAPNRRQTAFEFWRLVCFHLVLRQNAYVQIVPGEPGRGWVGQLVPLHPDRIRGPEELASGRLRYEYTRSGSEKVYLIGGIDIWHLTGLSSDGLKGMSMIDVAGDSFGVSMAAESHSANFLGRGVNFAGILQHPRQLKTDVAQAMSESFGRAYGGSANSGKIPVLWEGMEFKPISMTLKDAEFLDSRKFSVAEIARWFGVPPHMVGDVERSTSWGTGIEEQGLQFLIYSLLPWIALLEQSIRFTLVVQPERYYPKFNVNAILRMNAQTQANVFATLIDKGVLSPNECRDLLDRNPRKGGDEYVDITKPATPAPPRPGPRPPFPPPPPDDDPDDEGAEARAAQVALKVAQARSQELLHEEDNALVKIATQHSKDTAAWRSAVAAFYGRFARRVSSTGLRTLAEAKTWCAGRRDLVLADGGLHKLTTDHPASDIALLGGLNAEG
jgi:HK97 family phage portal protein